MSGILKPKTGPQNAEVSQEYLQLVLRRTVREEKVVNAIFEAIQDDNGDIDEAKLRYLFFLISRSYGEREIDGRYLTNRNPISRIVHWARSFGQMSGKNRTLSTEEKNEVAKLFGGLREQLSSAELTPVRDGGDYEENREVLNGVSSRLDSTLREALRTAETKDLVTRAERILNASELFGSQAVSVVVGLDLGEAGIGLAPVVGDIATLALPVAQLGYTRPSWNTLLESALWSAADAAIGLVPAIGDAADFGIFSNTRNYMALQMELAEVLQELVRRGVDCRELYRRYLYLVQNVNGKIMNFLFRTNIAETAKRLQGGVNSGVKQITDGSDNK